MTTEEEERWYWGRYAPDEWFTDRAASSVMIRGYLALGVEAPPSEHELAVWSGHLQSSETLVSWMRGSIEVPPQITIQFLGGERLAAHRSEVPARLPPGVYLVLMVPVRAPYRAVDGETERDALARIDTAAGLVAAFFSPNAIYQHAFEFLAEASGPGMRVMTPPIRRPGPVAVVSNDALHVLGDAMRAILGAANRLPARATTSLRWYAQAQAERNRPDAFVKYWIALEALAFAGNGSPNPLTDLLAASYERDAAWVRDTFAIDSLAQLRNAIVHSGERPMLHGNLLALVDALYVDALRARIGLPNEQRAERALPEGRPFRVARWRNNGGVATAFLPDVIRATPQGDEPESEAGQE